MTQNLSGIEQLIARLENLDGGAMFDLSLALSASAMTEVANGFRHSRDPYGNTWEPLKSRQGQPLLKTAQMARSVRLVRYSEGGFTIKIGADYAKYHQAGTHAHARAARLAKQNARGRFVRQGRSGYLLKIGAHTNSGIPRRQMLPEESTGGLGPIWSNTFARDTVSFLRRRLGRGD